MSSQASSGQGHQADQSVAPRRRRSRIGRISELKLTSMLDVTFLLLIFFILTVNFNVSEGILPADLLTEGSGPLSAPQVPTTPVVVRLADAGHGVLAIQLQDEPVVHFQQLHDKLEQWHIDQPGGFLASDNPIRIAPQGRVPWQSVMEAMNTVYRADYRNVQFTDPR